MSQKNSIVKLFPLGPAHSKALEQATLIAKRERVPVTPDIEELRRYAVFAAAVRTGDEAGWLASKITVGRYYQIKAFVAGYQQALLDRKAHEEPEPDMLTAEERTILALWATGKAVISMAGIKITKEDQS